MKGIVIAQDNGNMSGQFRMFQKKLTGAATVDKAYGLDSAILDLCYVSQTMGETNPNNLVISVLDIGKGCYSLP
jgi:hypothetical protein